MLKTKLLPAALLFAALTSTAAHATVVIDQSQLSFNTGVPLLFQGGPTNMPLGQSFTAGKTGVLAGINLGSNGGIQGGSNTLTFDIHAGDGLNGAVLGHGVQTVSSVWTPSVGLWLVSLNTTNLGVQLQAGQKYTFDFTGISGSGDLAYRGLLGKTTNPYAGGRIYTGPGYGNQPNWDLVFQTSVGPVPEPETWGMMLGGLALLGLFAKRRKAVTVS